MSTFDPLAVDTGNAMSTEMLNRYPGVASKGDPVMPLAPTVVDKAGPLTPTLGYVANGVDFVRAVAAGPDAYVRDSLGVSPPGCPVVEPASAFGVTTTPY